MCLLNNFITIFYRIVGAVFDCLTITNKADHNPNK